DVKFAGGRMKHLVKWAYADTLPAAIAERRDKMGFPVPLKEWFDDELRDFLQDIFRSKAARQRSYMNADAVLTNFDRAGRFSRKVWGLLSLELWQQLYHHRASEYRRMLDGGAEQQQARRGARALLGWAAAPRGGASGPRTPRRDLGPRRDPLAGLGVSPALSALSTPSNGGHGDDAGRRQPHRSPRAAIGAIAAPRRLARHGYRLPQSRAGRRGSP